MGSNSRRLPAWIAGITLLLLAPAVGLAQEDASGSSDDNRLFLEVDGWIAQLSGADITPSVRLDPVEPLFNETIGVDLGTENRPRTVIGYKLPNGAGELVFVWYSHASNGVIERLTPGQFGFGTKLAPTTPVTGDVLTLDSDDPFNNGSPVFVDSPPQASRTTIAGTFDDGRADGFRTDYDTKVRDLRLAYRRKAFETERMTGRWSIGYRRFSLQRLMETTYYALAPNLPAALPPVSNPAPRLEPQNDTVFINSEYSGRGLELGFDFKFEALEDRIWVEAGTSFSALRGRITNEYRSVLHWYVIREDDTDFTYVDPRDSLTFEAALASDALASTFVQEDVRIGVRVAGEPTSGLGIEAYLGFRARLWRDIQLTGGFRTASFDNVLQDLLPASVSPNEGASRFDVVGTERIGRTVNLEGYYLGVSYSY